jgi:AcrR family transcriptional regulator
VSSRGSYPKGIAQRERILAAALDTVAQHGFSRSWTKTVAAQVGLTHAGLMHYFASREELYQEVLRVREERDRDDFADIPQGIEGFLAVIEHNQHVPGLVQLYVEFSADATHPSHPAHDYFAGRYAGLREALQRDVTLAQAQGEMAEDADPAAVAELLIAAADGLQVQWLLDDGVDMVATVRNHLLKVTFLAL